MYKQKTTVLTAQTLGNFHIEGTFDGQGGTSHDTGEAGHGEDHNGDKHVDDTRAQKSYDGDGKQDVKGSLYVEVAQSLGCKDSRLLFVHIFPGTIQSLIVNFTMRIGSTIMAASSLSFLGFGANVTDPEWGAMLSQSRSYLNVAPHMVYFPGYLLKVA